MMTRSPWMRVIEVITSVALAVCAGGGFMALRALVWRQEHMITPMLLSGALVAGVVMLVGGAVYILFGRLMLRVFAIDWLSLRLGALIAAVVYGGYNALAPLTPAHMAESIPIRAVQGAFDGIVIGALLGVITAFVSGRRVTLDGAALARYSLLYLVLLIIAGVIVMVESIARLPDVAFVLIAIPAVIAVRIAVAAIDRHADTRSS